MGLVKKHFELWRFYLNGENFFLLITLTQFDALMSIFLEEVGVNMTLLLFNVRKTSKVELKELYIRSYLKNH